jgi:Acetyltransferase (GNAT) domain
MPAEAEPRYDGPAVNDATALRLCPIAEGRVMWRELVNDCPQATIYQRDSWIELLQRAYGLSLWLATLHRGESAIAGCIFARAPFSRRRFVALSFSDSCPPLAREPLADHWLLAALATQGPSNQSYEVRGIRGVEHWESTDCFVNWRLDLDQPMAAIERGLASNFRRNLRRASRQAITVERGSNVDLLRRFYVLQLESRRRLGLPAQPWRFFDLTREIFAEHAAFEVWTASDNGMDVASAVFLRDGDTVHYKWGARQPAIRSDGNHLLFWNAIEEFARSARVLDLGRADVRNTGLMRFKSELGATSIPLPWSFYPRAPKEVSSEVLTGTRAALAKVWSRLPLPVTQLAGRVIYRFLA